MKRIILALGVATAGSLLAVAPAQAASPTPSLCYSYSFTIFGTTYAGTQCLPG